MYSILVFLHSTIRWLVVISLAYAAYRGYKGYKTNAPFLPADHIVRHWTATIAHVQLVLGIMLYTQSPVVKYFWNSPKTAGSIFDALFYALLHFLGMLTAIVLITIGSALAKRKTEDKARFKTMFTRFTIAFII